VLSSLFERRTALSILWSSDSPPSTLASRTLLKWPPERGYSTAGISDAMGNGRVRNCQVLLRGHGNAFGGTYLSCGFFPTVTVPVTSSSTTMDSHSPSSYSSRYTLSSRSRSSAGLSPKSRVQSFISVSVRASLSSAYQPRNQTTN